MSPIAVFLCLLIFVASGLAGHTEVNVRPGQDVTLQCWGPRDAEITLLEWSRPDLSSEGYVLFYRNKRPYEKYQHESFKGRVELRDPSMRDGDVSVYLRNVNIRDTGTYECLITTSSIIGGQRVVSEVKHSISLTVTDSGSTHDDAKYGGYDYGGHVYGGDKYGGNEYGGPVYGGHEYGGNEYHGYEAGVDMNGGDKGGWSPLSIVSLCLGLLLLLLV
ncbi:nectin-4-like [Archocentrus centrarchus]|uniref:nectin-4-like n=1 Tax=Archocentrus centrarchus TaxID=63155 RepID=UPI0011E9F761|nr:nectin-4-like [Archocentrus centrarchus]